MREQFDLAKAYIQQKKYAEARKLLKTIDHPKAKEWLTKLDSIAPEKRSRRGLLIFTLIVLVAAVVIGLMVVQSSLSSMSTNFVRGASDSVATEMAATRTVEAGN